MTIHPCYIGCDISKASLDFYDPDTSKLVSVGNTPDAIAAHLQVYRDRSVFVVYEATGTYDRALAHALAETSIPSHRINPMQAKRFAQAIGQKAKTDPLDARMLADLGARLTPVADNRPAPEREALAGLHRRRDQLVELRKRERTRVKEETCPRLKASHDQVISLLSEEIALFDEEIAALIKADQKMCREAALLQTAPGVGPVTVTTLIALMPELGTINPKQAASLAGLAPFNHDSGKLKGRRCISGGRRRVRRALYMAALNAVRRSDRFQTFYQRLTARNQAKKVALITFGGKTGPFPFSIPPHLESYSSF